MSDQGASTPGGEYLSSREVLEQFARDQGLGGDAVEQALERLRTVRPDCLTTGDVVAIARGQSDLTAHQAEHLQDCAYCQAHVDGAVGSGDADASGFSKLAEAGALGSEVGRKGFELSRRMLLILLAIGFVGVVASFLAGLAVGKGGASDSSDSKIRAPLTGPTAPTEPGDDHQAPSDDEGDDEVESPPQGWAADYERLSLQIGEDGLKPEAEHEVRNLAIELLHASKNERQRLLATSLLGQLLLECSKDEVCAELLLDLKHADGQTAGPFVGTYMRRSHPPGRRASLLQAISTASALRTNDLGVKLLELVEHSPDLEVAKAALRSLHWFKINSNRVRLLRGLLRGARLAAFGAKGASGDTDTHATHSSAPEVARWGDLAEPLVDTLRAMTGRKENSVRAWGLLAQRFDRRESRLFSRKD